MEDNSFSAKHWGGREDILLLCFEATKPGPGEMEIQTMRQPPNNKNDVAYS